VRTATTALAALALAACAHEGDDAMTAEASCAERAFSFADVEGARLHYRLEGTRTDGRPVVVLHGAYANLCDPALAFLPRMAEDRRVLLVDRPGLGRSTRPKDGADPRVQARLARALAADLGLEDPIVLGHSYGGAVALAYGLDTVERPDAGAGASGLLLLAPVSHVWPGGVNWWNDVSATPLLGFLFRRTVVPLIGPVMVRNAVASDVLPPDYAERTDPGSFLRPRVFRNNAEDLVRLKPIIAEMAPRYASLSMPIEIRAGRDDETVYTEIHARRLAEDAPDARLQVYDGVGHLIHYARTDEVFAALRSLDARVAEASGD